MVVNLLKTVEMAFGRPNISDDFFTECYAGCEKSCYSKALILFIYNDIVHKIHE